MEAPAKRDDALSSGGFPGDLHGGFDSLGARVHEEQPVNTLGGDADDVLGSVDERLVQECAASVPEPVELGFCCSDDVVRPVAQVGRGDACREVEVLFSVGTCDPAAFAFDDLGFVVERDNRCVYVVEAFLEVSHHLLLGCAGG